MKLYECDGKIEKCKNDLNCKNQGGMCHSTFDPSHSKTNWTKLTNFAKSFNVIITKK